MDGDLVATIGQLLAAVLSGVGGGQIVAAIARRKQRKVVAETGLSAGAIKWAQELKADADDARAESRQAWQEARQARDQAEQAMRSAALANYRAEETERRLTVLTRQAKALSDYVGKLVGAIEDPGMDMRQLRLLVSNEGPPIITLGGPRNSP